MRLLLDTQAFLWFVTGDARLSQQARQAIEDDQNEVFLSIASAWEMAIKHSLGKLVLTQPFEVLMARAIRENGLRLLPVELAHTAAAGDLPFHHRDPFDRMLIAQAQVGDLPAISADASFDAYGVRRIW
jgi:PIN domain nuclease of toxin-antitoxin system